MWQPWASMVAAGLKKYETRGWGTEYRGPLAIHSAVRPVAEKYAKQLGKYGFKAAELPLGKVLCVCELTDCALMTEDLVAAQSETETDWGDWVPGRYAWKLENIRVLPAPAPAKGHQGLWNWNDEN